MYVGFSNYMIVSCTLPREDLWNIILHKKRVANFLSYSFKSSFYYTPTNSSSNSFPSIVSFSNKA
jgi:hypothetical protein